MIGEAGWDPSCGHGAGYGEWCPVCAANIAADERARKEEERNDAEWDEHWADMDEAREHADRVARFLEEISNDDAHDLMVDLVNIIMSDRDALTTTSDAYESVEAAIKTTLQED